MNHEIVKMTLTTDTKAFFGVVGIEAVLHIAVTGFDAEERTVDYYVESVYSTCGHKVHESWGDSFTDEQIEEELWRQHDEAAEEAALEAAIDRYESDQFYLTYCIY